jgi:light-harvesting protein B-800-850 alpha chain
MYYGRIWCVVKPSVGIPLMLGAVAVTSLVVHIGVLTHTSWYPAFLEGGKNKMHSEIAAPAAPSLALTSPATPATKS